MDDFYKITFGYSGSEGYQQALELASLAHTCEFHWEGENRWNVLYFDETQIDLMAQIWQLTKGCPFRPKIHGADYLRVKVFLERGIWRSDSGEKAPRSQAEIGCSKLVEEHGSPEDALAWIEKTFEADWQDSIQRTRERLGQAGYIKRRDEDGFWVMPTRKPSEHHLAYLSIRNAIEEGAYQSALQQYYDFLEGDEADVLHSELLYLKRLAQVPFEGRDLTPMRADSSRTDLISQNIKEYAECVDELLQELRQESRQSPLQVLTNYMPTMEDLLERTRRQWHDGVWLDEERDGPHRDSTPVSEDTFSNVRVAGGRMFSRYPKPFYSWHELEGPLEVWRHRLWTKYSEAYVQKEVFEKGLRLRNIDVWRRKDWRRGSKKREPDFSETRTISQLEVGGWGVGGIEYTGRSHTVEGVTFYEVHLLRENRSSDAPDEHPFRELVAELLREAENRLRERHDLPRIGQGWVSETRLFHLVKKHFQGAIQHATPDWLSPQHLDVYVPKQRLAFEYHGRQHFEPVEFFGGQEAHEDNDRRDARKAKICEEKNITLIEWRFDEDITEELLLSKLEDADDAI